MTDFDSPWKEMLEVYFEPFMALFFSEAHRQIDWERGYELLDYQGNPKLLADAGRNPFAVVIRAHLAVLERGIGGAVPRCQQLGRNAPMGG